MKVVGEFCRRIRDVASYPSQVTAQDRWLLHHTLQPIKEGENTVEPKDCFPPAGKFNSVSGLYEGRMAEGCFMAVCGSSIYLTFANPDHANAISCIYLSILINDMYIYCAMESMQEPPALLSTWLQFSHQSVTRASVDSLLDRVQTWKSPKEHAEYVKLLATDSRSLDNLPDCVNPALLCLMRAAKEARKLRTSYLPAFDPPPTAVSPDSSKPVPSVSWDIGTIMWLFDEDQPYLAEVFSIEQLPRSRLPHLNRRGVPEGHCVVRVLGVEKSHVVHLRKTQTMLPFSDECAPLPHACEHYAPA